MWEKEESDTDKADESETGEEHNRVLSEELYLKKQNDGVLLKDSSSANAPSCASCTQMPAHQGWRLTYSLSTQHR